MTRTKQLLMISVFIMAFSSPLVLGQSANQGAIIGTITDPSGAVIPGVSLTVTNVQTGVNRPVISDDRGNYRADFLPPGQYKITAEAPGFKKVELTEINLQVGQLLRADVKLIVGEISESVTVAAGAGIVNTDTPTLGQVIDNVKIENLPLNGREFIALAALVAGAESGNVKRGVVFSKGVAVGFNGARSENNSYSVDGAESTDADRNQLISSPALDAIREFRVETNMYSAQYGRSGGAVILVTTKSGTNKYHGSLYEYHRNKALDARPFFYYGAKEQQPGYLFHQFGGSVGGPIIKNKTFFFFSAEGFRQKKPGNNLVSFAPTDRERAGDMSQSINPWSGKPVVLVNPYTQEVIPDGKVPANLVNPLGKFLMGFFPRPNYNDPITNLRYMRVGTFDQNKWLARIDHSFNEKNTLSGTFNFGNYDNITPGHTSFGDLNGLEHDRTLALTYTRSFSPSLINDLKFSYTRFNHGDVQALEDKDYAKEWGIFSDSSGKGSPRIVNYTIGFSAFQMGGQGDNSYKDRNTYIKEGLAWTKGNHAFFFGADFYRQDFNWDLEVTNTAPLLYFGYYDGDPTYSQYYGASGYIFSSLLMGLSPYSLWEYQRGVFSNLGRNMFAGWAQDDWKIAPRLTLNLGLRYDYLTPFSEKSGRIATLNYQTGEVVYAAKASKDELSVLQFHYATGGPDRPYEPAKTNFSPRVGLAFRPFDNNRTVLRGGYGIFYTMEPGRYTSWSSWVPPFKASFSHNAHSSYWPDKKDHFVTIDQKPYQLDSRRGSTPGWSVFAAQDYPPGYYQQWNLAIQREVVKRMAVQIAWVGSKGTNLSGLTPMPPDLQQRILKNAAIYPGLMGKGFNSKYHSLQVEAKKDFSNGLNFLAAFTWGHAMAESSNNEFNDNIINDSVLAGNIVRRRYSNADFDFRRRFVVSGGYELPWGRGKVFGADWNAATNAILGGWQVNWIYTLSRGYPYTVWSSYGSYPDRVCDGNLPSSERNPNRWFDYTCFVPHKPTPVTLPDGTTRLTNINGNANPNIIVGPGINNLDLGIQKNFGVNRISEDARVQLRVETFNTLNHPNFVGPSQIFYTNPSGAQLGVARDSRDIQLALKILF